MSPQQKVAVGVTAVVALATPVVVFYEGERTVPYRDIVNVVTDCYGHTKTAEMGKINTHADCMRKLGADMAEHDAGLVQCITVPVADHVHAALLSWTFNIGVAAACRSELIRKLNAGDTMGACAELSRWVMAGGKRVQGLVNRRTTERSLCEGRSISLGAQG